MIARNGLPEMGRVGLFRSAGSRADGHELDSVIVAAVWPRTISRSPSANMPLGLVRT
jgi:hypothetical protein